MCGLVATWDRNIPTSKVEAALHLMDHRGVRDTYIQFDEPELKIGHVRLPINGLGTDWDHPIVMHTPRYENDSQALWMVGEYYDFDQTRYKADTAQFAEMFGSMPLDGIPQLPGMYHTVIVRGKSLFVLQDSIGKKPIYYAPSIKAIASEIKALTYLMDNECTINKDYIHQASRGFLPTAGSTPYNEIIQLDPRIINVFNLRTGEDWPLAYNMEATKDSWKEEESGTLLSALVHAVKIRLTASDMPVAMVLSGGLDSAIIYQIAKQINPKIRVFHVENDEREYLNTLGIEPTYITAIDYPKNNIDIRELLYFNESPLDLGSLIPQFLLGRAIKDSLVPYNVVVSGDGADEIFSGYKRALKTDTQKHDLLELKTWHLPRLDKMMMAHTIEMRSPYLDERVMVKGLSTSWPNRKGKKQLKEIAKMVGVPESIIHREKKPLKSPWIVDDKSKWQKQLAAAFVHHFGRGLIK